MDIVFWCCAVILAAAFITDVREMKIPNPLTLTAIISGLIYQGIHGGWQGLAFAGKGFAAGFIILLIMYWIGAVGAGDVKLFGGIGTWMGALFTIQCIVYSVLFAGVIGLIIMLWRKETMKRLRKVAGGLAGFFVFRNAHFLKGDRKEQLRFPFMLAVVPGYVIAYFYF